MRKRASQSPFGGRNGQAEAGKRVRSRSGRLSEGVKGHQQPQQGRRVTVRAVNRLSSTPIRQGDGKPFDQAGARPNRAAQTESRW